MQQIFISVCLRYLLSTQLLSAEKTRKDNHEKLREYQRHDGVTGKRLKKTDIDRERKTFKRRARSNYSPAPLGNPRLKL